MSMKTSLFFGCLLLLLNGSLAGNGDHHRSYHHHHHNFYRQYHHHDYEDYDGFEDEEPYFYNFGFVGPRRPHGPPPGHQNPCDFVPPGHRNKGGDDFEFLPPGQQKKRPCPFTPGPSFEFPPTQPPSFIDLRPPAANANKDFSFPIVQEVINDHSYHIHGYTDDEFPVILLHKSDIRK